MSLAGRIVLLQGALGFLCLIVFLCVDLGEGTAALLATITVVTPGAYYAWFQQRTFNATRLLLHGVYKIAATVVLMALCFVVLDAEPLGFFVTFAVLQLAYFAGLGMRAT